ncbi:hypothetical protein [Mycobacteroides salmoniphilum]|uniref:Uncharacterized protein n=1 Tax=Mycobacteroides salmoniphilum TaxID=404941 RepID=A0A4R8SQG3_9MYCO|nr:hypothetical protein [Mycobacteroides salmoniphilum]TDZ91419.1 hypothetical protein CCUG62472_04678 [Mycobacteroides salmoniphilum]TEA01296.1 hypothetical protein CCUG60884_04045 [Mycobacteroides salmoniphilum]
MASSNALSTSWDVFRTSIRLLRHHKNLVLFPVAAALTVTLFVVVLIALGLLLPPNIDKTAPQFVRAALAVDYAVLVYLMMFWLTALIAQANDALEGRGQSVAHGFATAVRYRTRLLPWALVDTAVTWGIGVIDENLLYVGNILHVLFIGRFLDLMWRAVSFQVLPAMVLRDVRARGAIKAAKNMLRRLLFKNILGQICLRVFTLVLVLPGVGLLFAAAAVDSGALSGVLGLCGGLWVAVALLIAATVSGVYQTELYRRASAA